MFLFKLSSILKYSIISFTLVIANITIYKYKRIVNGFQGNLIILVMCLIKAYSLVGNPNEVDGKEKKRSYL